MYAQDEIMPDSYYKTLLLEGREKVLRDLAALASEDRPASEARRFSARAQVLLQNLGELDIAMSSNSGPGGMDYRDDVEINVAIIRYLQHIGRPAKEDELTRELIRGQFPGYRDARKMAIRVGRCVRSYTLGKPSENPKLKCKHGLVGLPGWSDKMFA